MTMAALVYLLLFLALTGYSRANYCVCKDGNQAALQKALDYACGAGADCTPIQTSGACYQPNTVLDHCSYAVNSYYQRKGQAVGSCDFGGAATVTASPPTNVASGCVYPSSASNAGTTPGTTPTTPTNPVTGTPPATGTPTIGTPTTGTPTTTPTTGTPPTTTGTTPPTTTAGTPTMGTPTTQSPTVFGLGPTGSGTGINDNGVASLKATSNLFIVASFTTLRISGMLLLWG